MFKKTLDRQELGYKIDRTKNYTGGIFIIVFSLILFINGFPSPSLKFHLIWAGAFVIGILIIIFSDRLARIAYPENK